ncbi:hypothetical protein [Scytonema sp. UIC 10036]|uniref:hypothetical protein n=1 Tax=Scytonema sp. UIC 10036 TaxID=2304196 RepID=UPI00140F7177|nr:hypothetical protein [Scytonema sp. UIC 10036]
MAIENNSIEQTQSSQPPLLPRSAWQNQQAFYRVIIKAKKALDIAEISALLK